MHITNIPKLPHVAIVIPNPLRDPLTVGVTALYVALALILTATWALAGGSTAQRDAPTVRFYDSRGNSTGSASTYGNTTRFYDARGNSLGSATNNNGPRR